MTPSRPASSLTFLRALAPGAMMLLVACGSAPTETSDPTGGTTTTPTGEAATSPNTPASPTSPGGTALPPGAYAGGYEVPVPPELAAAATYKVAEINWKVAADNTARLAYTLPLGLVGTSVRVDFTGTFDPATQTATLTGLAGTSSCQVTTATVVCHETMRGLLPIAADLGIVQSIAATEYAGPAQDRVAVAQRFIGDPIGIVKVDLGTGTPEPEPVDDKKK